MCINSDEKLFFKTVVRFLTTADEAIVKGKNFKDFGAAAADKMTVREIQVSECFNISDLSRGNQRGRAGGCWPESTEDLFVQ